MKTDDLIKALAADAKSVEPPIAKTLVVALVIGTLVTLVGFLYAIGVRPDFVVSALNSMRFLFKFIVTLSVAIPAFLLVRDMARPDFVPKKQLLWLALAPALLLAGTILEMAFTPADTWHARMIGENRYFCMTLIPLMALAPFAAVLYTLKSGAPASPGVAGAIGGLLSAGIAATLYASHCPDDSPLFVAAWYPVGFVVMGVLGAIIGSRLLRW